jgi:ribosome recycling factor
MLDEILKDAEERMQKSIESLKLILAKVRTGRASPTLIQHLTVDYYGTPTPISQVANVTVQDARTLGIQPWEKPMVPLIEKAIMESDLGLNPMTSGEIIRIPLPPLTEERRKEMAKVVNSEGENGKIAIRNSRRDANGSVKELLKEKEITEDDDKVAHDRIQKVTDSYIAKVDDVVADKEKEIMTV